MRYRKKTGKSHIKLSEAEKRDHIEFLRVIKSAVNLRKKKLHDYGLSYRRFGVIGLLARIDDKLSRIGRSMHYGLKNENARDSAIDIANYAIMLAMEIRGQDD